MHGYLPPSSSLNSQDPQRLQTLVALAAPRPTFRDWNERVHGNGHLVEALLRRQAAVASDFYFSGNTQHPGSERHILACAAFSGCDNFLSTLVMAAAAAGGDAAGVNRATTTGEYPIHIAARRGNGDFVRALLACGAKVNVRVDPDTFQPSSLAKGLSALHWAALRGHSDIVADLVARGAHADATILATGESPLHLAARCGHHDTVGVLLDAGANPRILSRSNLCPMDLAACNDHPLTVAEFLFRGAEPNTANPLGYTALHQAAYHGAGGALEVLVEAGGSLRAVTAHGCTPLHVAAFSPISCVHNKSTDKGSSNGSSSSSSSSSADRSPTYVVHAVARDSDQAVDIDAVDDSGSTPLRTACMYLREHAVADLLSMGANESLVNLSRHSFITSADRDSTATSAPTPDCCSSRTESITRVMAMLAAAAANRAWNRRGWLAMLRLRQHQEGGYALGGRGCVSGGGGSCGGRASDDLYRKSKRRYREIGGGKALRCDRRKERGSGVGACAQRARDERGGSLHEALIRTLRVEDEGIFKRIVLFL